MQKSTRDVLHEEVALVGVESNEEGAGRRFFGRKRSPPRIRRPTAELSLQRRITLVNAAFLLVTTAWFAADAAPAKPAPVVSSAPVASASVSGCCGSTSSCGCESDCCCKPSLMQRLKARFQRDKCCECNSCGSSCGTTSCSSGCASSSSCRASSSSCCGSTTTASCCDSCNSCCKPSLMDRLRARMNRNKCCESSCCDSGCGATPSATMPKAAEPIPAPKDPGKKMPNKAGIDTAPQYLTPTSSVGSSSKFPF